MFKLNPRRSFRCPVNVTVLEGDKEQTGSFTAEFQVTPTTAFTDSANRDKRLLDLVLIGVEGVEVDGEDGKPLQGDDLLNALKADPATSLALVNAYQEGITKKNRPRT
jgi:hypothetical protein